MKFKVYSEGEDYQHTALKQIRVHLDRVDIVLKAVNQEPTTCTIATSHFIGIVYMSEHRYVDTKQFLAKNDKNMLKIVI